MTIVCATLHCVYADRGMPRCRSSAATAAGAGVLAADEAERLVEALQPMALEDVGTPKWMQQHMVFEKLNAQAHHNAMTNSDPFVLEALLTFDKLSVVVRELITVEAWKEHVFPRCRDRIAELGSLRAYFIVRARTHSHVPVTAMLTRRCTRSCTTRPRCVICWKCCFSIATPARLCRMTWWTWWITARASSRC